MIEAQTPNATATAVTETPTMETPQTITTTMILTDLENGIDRPGIKTKYNLEGWELTEMFKHPVLKGKKASRKRKMSFTFVDDTPQTETISTTTITPTDEEEHYTDEQMLEMHTEAEDAEKSRDADDANEFSNGFDQ